MAAIAWLAQQPAELIEELERSKDRTGESLAMLGTDAVRQGLANLPPGEFRTGTIRSALEFIGYSDPVASQALMQGLGGAERAAAIEGLAIGWVEREPRTALEFVYAQRDETATESALARWSIMDPAAAHGWMLEKVGSDPVAVAERVETIGLADTWARRDPLAAGEAMLALIEQIRTRDPKGAAEWAASIGDPDLRAEASSSQ